MVSFFVFIYRNNYENYLRNGILDASLLLPRYDTEYI